MELTVAPIVMVALVLLLFSWLGLKVCMVQRSYYQEKAEAEKDEKIERLEAEVSRLTGKDIL